jgi:hypothetical protein
MKRNNETLYRTYQEPLQFNHVQEIKKQLLGNTHSDGKLRQHISWL